MTLWLGLRLLIISLCVIILGAMIFGTYRLTGAQQEAVMGGAILLMCASLCYESEDN